MPAQRASVPPVIDGDLSDPAWQGVPVQNGMRQSFPEPGQPASLKTDIKVIYDEEALYVSAFCHDPRPEEIVARLSRRDRDIESDWFQIDIDSRMDKRTGFFFKVNAAGVQQDGVIYDENHRDSDWDGVWESEAKIVESGWAVEMRLPLKLLRFQSGENVRFGINFTRRSSRLNETTLWQYIAPDSSQWVSQFGELNNLSLDSKPLQLELSPYVAGRLAFGDGEDVRPFDLGLDGKVNLGSDFMLTLTANPDFGQVEADQVVLNLSTIETYLPEKRPFFLEDKSLFRMTKFGDSDSRADLFYTRRIGQLRTALEVPDSHEVVEDPRAPRIWGAAKLAGRTDSRLSMGLLQAVTSAESARIQRADGSRYDKVAQPLTSYSILRLSQGFGENSTVGLMATAVAAKKSGEAFTGGTDLNWAMFEGKYQLTLISRLSYLTEERFDYQDDFTRASLEDNPFGYGAELNFWKKSGEHFVYAVGGDYRSPSLSLNDVGYLDRPDIMSTFFWGQLRRLKKWGPIAQMMLNVNGWLYRNTDNVVLGDGGNINGHTEFTNNMYAGLYLGFNTTRCDDRETRTAGRVVLCGKDPTMQTGIWASTDARKMFTLKLNGSYFTTQLKHGLWAQLTLLFNPLSNLQFELIPGYRTARGELRWMDTENEGTVDERFIFAEQRNDYLDVTFRSTVTFTTELTLQAYAQMFLAAVDYRRKYHGLAEGNRLDLDDLVRTSEVADDDDLTTGDLNLGLVLRWEYLPGSVGYLVYTGVFGSEDDQRANFQFDETFGDLMKDDAQHILMLKISYMWG